MTQVRVLIPWRDAGCDWRRDALAVVDDHWRMTAPPAWSITIAVHPDDGPWSKGRALAGYLAGQPPAGVTVVADADVIPWGQGVERTVDAVAGELHAWGIPHTALHRLTPDATRRLTDIGLAPGESPTRLPTCERPYTGVEGGGIVVVRNEVLERVPLDPRFEGWGGEDQAWALALRAIAGRPWRDTDPLIHLWHPPQPRRSRKRGSRESQALYRRYVTNRRDPEAMRALLDEAKEAATCSAT